MGWTVSRYDQNGRAVSVESFDGSGVPGPWGGNGNGTGTTSMSYDGQVTTVTDQALHVRVNSSDGLGRLTSVGEDPGSAAHLNYLTLYGYDALDDLVSVNQSAAYGLSLTTR